MGMFVEIMVFVFQFEIMINERYTDPEEVRVLNTEDTEDGINADGDNENEDTKEEEIKQVVSTTELV